MKRDPTIRDHDLDIEPDASAAGIAAKSRQRDRNVAFINSSLVYGGAERVISILTGTLAAGGSRVSVITLSARRAA